MNAIYEYVAASYRKKKKKDGRLIRQTSHPSIINTVLIAEAKPNRQCLAQRINEYLVKRCVAWTVQHKKLVGK
jgi:hypothetical protein